MEFEQWFQEHFDDKTLDLPKGDLKFYIKEFAREAWEVGGAVTLQESV